MMHPLDATANAAGPRRQLETASWFAVVRAYLECNRRYAQMLQHFDLTVTQYEVLITVQRLGDGAAPKAIAEQLLVTRANMSGVVKRLRERALLRTTASAADGRSYLCSLTPDGRALLGRAQAAAARFIRAQLAPFADAELAAVEKLMHRMRDHLAGLEPDQLALGAADEPQPAPRTGTITDTQEQP